MNIITNKSGKIIHLGSMMLLPGESGELPKAYENNPIVFFLESRGAMEVARKDTEVDEKVTPSEAPAENPSPAEIPLAIAFRWVSFLEVTSTILALPSLSK